MKIPVKGDHPSQFKATKRESELYHYIMSTMVDVVSEVLKNEQKDRKTALREIQQRLSQLDENSLVKGALYQIFSANIAALKTYAENVELRRSVLTNKGEDLPAYNSVVKEAFSDG